MRRLVVLPLLLAGCGSLDAHQLPPAATPAGSRPAAAPARSVALPGGRSAVLRVRERVLELRAGRQVLARAGAGVGPAAVAADPAGRWLYVTDTTGGAVLVFGLRPRLELVHRVYLPGAPYAISVGRGRLWVTLTARDRLAELNVRRRPQVLRRLPGVTPPR